jgi:cytochrome c556
VGHPRPIIASARPIGIIGAADAFWRRSDGAARIAAAIVAPRQRPGRARIQEGEGHTRMRLATIPARLLAGAALAVTIAVPLALAQGDVLTARKDGFKMLAANMEAIQKVVQERQPVAAAVAPARAIAEHAPKIKTLFPPGSDAGQTRALPAIWSDRAGFDRVADAFVTQANALVAAAEGGNASTLGSALQATGQACGMCHRPYRAPAR